MEYFKRAAGLHNKIGSDLAALGGLLRCMHCGYEQPLNAEQIGKYLAKGWPEHCGSTMRWITQNNLDEERR